MRLECHPHQSTTLGDLTSPSRALVTGYGGGKTWTLARWCITRALANPVGTAVLAVEPTWRMARRVLIPEMRTALEQHGIAYSLNRADLTFAFRGRQIYVASGEIPENLSGMTVACAAIDEPGIQDEEVDRRVVSRIRDPRAVLRQVLYVGTHEGLGWFYRRTRDIPTITVPSYANAALTPDSIQRLKDRFKDDEIRYRMYVLGEPCALSGSIYTCLAERHFRKCENPRDGNTVIGMDFNVGLMVTPVCRKIGNEVHVYGEVISRQTTTEAHVAKIVDYLVTKCGCRKHEGQYGLEILDCTGERVDAFIDASGGARKTSASKTDKQIVKDAGLWPKCPPSNPLVRERVERVQSALSGDRLYVDHQAAPFTARALREHAYASNTDPPEPQKKWREGEDALDAATDALGYIINGVSYHVVFHNDSRQWRRT